MNTDIVIKNLTSTDAQLLTTLSGRGQDIFTTRDAERVLRKPNPAVRKILHHLVKRRWLQRLEKGKYLIVPLSAGPEGHYTENELVIASHLIKPYYIGFWTALSHYGYTEQPTRSVYIATTKRRQPLELQGVRYRFISLTHTKFFGQTRVWIGDKAVAMSDRAKTIADGLDHPEYCGGLIEIAKALWRGRSEIDLGRVLTYAKKMKNGAILKRLGFLLDLLELGSPEFRKRLRAQLSAGYAVLDPLYPHQGKHNASWRVLVNLSEHDLISWRET